MRIRPREAFAIYGATVATCFGAYALKTEVADSPPNPKQQIAKALKDSGIAARDLLLEPETGSYSFVTPDTPPDICTGTYSIVPGEDETIRIRPHIHCTDLLPGDDMTPPPPKGVRS